MENIIMTLIKAVVHLHVGCCVHFEQSLHSKKVELERFGEVQ